MVFEFLDLKPRNPYLSLAIDQALSEHTAQPGVHGGIRLWTNPTSVILGRSCRAEANLVPDLIRRFRVSHSRSKWTPAVCRRASGGGTVVHGPGNLNYSIFVPIDRYPSLYPVKASYSILLEMVRHALFTQGIDARLEGKSDLVIAGNPSPLKVSGNAQFRKHGVLVHHGTLITRPNLIGEVKEYLLHPPEEPAYRAGRSHEGFLGSLPESFDVVAFYQVLSSSLRDLLGAPAAEAMPPEERMRVIYRGRELVREIYACPHWILEGVLPSAVTSVLHPEVRIERAG